MIFEKKAIKLMKNLLESNTTVITLSSSNEEDLGFKKNYEKNK